MKRDCQKRVKEKGNKKKDGEDAKNKRAEVTEGQLYTMFTSPGDKPLGIDFSDLREDDEFTWHQFHVEGWGARDFEGHANW